MTNGSGLPQNDAPQACCPGDRLDAMVWAASDVLLTAAGLRIGGRTVKPALLVQQIFGGMWPSTPREVFSEEIPPRDTSESITIDTMGAYCPDAREIKIYTQLIETFSASHELVRDDVEFIVRVHEYSHAFVHIGVVDCAHFEDEGLFLSSRRNVYGSIVGATHELLAQAVTWIALGENTDLRETLEAMLPSQPAEYNLTPELKANLCPGVLRCFLSLMHSCFFTEAELGNTSGIRRAFENPPTGADCAPMN